MTVAKYIRLSSEDDDNNKNGKTESNSVSNQRDLLDDFIRKSPKFAACKTVEFCDDVYSGVNFDRPAFKELLKAATDGEINCIIVKDLSRLGRNYLEVGNYLEQVFPALNIQFIAVNDMYNSNEYLGLTAGIDIAFRNLIYEMYSRDLSEKTRSALTAKVKRGECIASMAVYGYAKSTQQGKRTLIIDENAANIGRIYDLKEQGLSSVKIAQTLNDEGVPTPQMYKNQNNINRKWRICGERNYWERLAVYRILADERYTGKLISHKQKLIEVGKDKKVLLPKEDWIIIPNAIPAIISEEQFALIQATKYNTYILERTGNKDVIFRNKIKCGVCKKAMPRKNNIGIKHTYRCSSKTYVNGLQCTNERFYEMDITTVVLEAIKHQAKLAEDITSSAQKKSQFEETSYSTSIKELQTLIEKAKLDKLFSYEKYRDGDISNESYLTISGEFTLSIQNYERQIADLETKVNTENQTLNQENSYAEHFKPYANIQTLTRDIVDKLVKVIYIYNSNNIEIVWNYSDSYTNLISKINLKNS
ncbi:recombinase [Clostridia bacterium]|nr:recombinase [Clostridia bacterium]